MLGPIGSEEPRMCSCKCDLRLMSLYHLAGVSSLLSWDNITCFVSCKDNLGIKFSITSNILERQSTIQMQVITCDEYQQ